MATPGKSNARCGKYTGCSGESRPYVMTGDSGMFDHGSACLFRSELLPGKATDMSWHVDVSFLICHV